MSKTTKNFSIDYQIAEQISSYLCPTHCIYKIKYLYSKSFCNEDIDKDGPTGDFDAILKQDIEEKIFEIIPDNKLDKNTKEYSINLLKKRDITIHYYPSQFILDIFTKCKIPESLFLYWIKKDNNLFKQKSLSFTYLSHQKIYSSNKIYDHVNENKSLKKNVFECILKTNYLKTVNKSFFRVKYEIYAKIKDLRDDENIFYVDGNGECIFEIYHNNIFFKSDIKKNNSDLTYKERASYIKNLINQKKIVESNPVSYFLESIKKLKVSYNFLLSSLNYDSDNMSYQDNNKAIKISYLERIV